MNRREMLAGLLALPFVPNFLSLKKEKASPDEAVRGDHACKENEDPHSNWRRHVAVITENGTFPLPIRREVTEHTDLEMTVECTMPCTITQVVFHVDDMVVYTRPKGNTIEVRKGDILEIKIRYARPRLTAIIMLWDEKAMCRTFPSFHVTSHSRLRR